jgi:Zn-dependent protease
MFKRGYFELGQLNIGKYGKVPLRIHWSAPVGALVLGGLSPVFWLAFFVIVLLHEVGHALLVRHYRLQVLSIDLTGFGGMCRWYGTPTARQRAIIAWGGVAAQALLLAVTLAAVLVFGYPQSGIGRQVANAFINTNAILIVLNLLPMPPFDGMEAWKLLTPWFRRLRDRTS